MKRWTLAVTTTVAFAAPAVAQAHIPAPHLIMYQHLYHEVARAHGMRAPGCNLFRTCHQKVTDGDVVKSIGILQRMLAPPAPVRSTYHAPVVSHTPHHYVTHYYAPTPAPTTAHVVTTSTTHSGGGVPSCASESGTNYSTGPSNTNGSSGATGRYQITPSTAANYGCNLSTPGGQDTCAATIYAHQGARAWVGCGG